MGLSQVLINPSKMSYLCVKVVHHKRTTSYNFNSKGSPTSKKLGNSVLCTYTHNISLPNKQAHTGENIEHNFGQRERERE